MTKLRLVLHHDKAEALYWLDKARRVLSADPVERDAALALLCKPRALIAVPTAAEHCKVKASRIKQAEAYRKLTAECALREKLAPLSPRK